MKRRLAPATCILLGIAACTDQDSVNPHPPAAVDQRSIENPRQQKVVSAILQNIHSREPSEVSEWLRVNYGVSNFHVAQNFVKTSYPPQVRVSFEMDGVYYDRLVRVPEDSKLWAVENESEDLLSSLRNHLRAKQDKSPSK